MKKFATLLLFSLTLTTFVHAQPWLYPVKICTSTNGTTFNTPTVFQDSSGVPTITEIGQDTLLAAFQWFPMPFQNAQHWDKVAVKFSYNGGVTWTTPITCVFTGSPAGFQRPFDPALTVDANGLIRMYFSDGPSISTMGSINTYSATSTDGINYTFDSGVRYDDATRNVIDPSAGIFNNTWYYNSWTGTSSDGNYRATATDGLTFTPQTMSPWDNVHDWLGNYMNDGSLLKFYGTSSTIWYNSTSDGVNWTGYVSTNINGADPGVVKTSSGTYVMIFTGVGPTGLQHPNNMESSIRIYPNPAVDVIHFDIDENTLSEGELTYQLMDVNGQIISEAELTSGKTDIDLNDLATGMYFYTISRNGEFVKRGKVVIQK